MYRLDAFLTLAQDRQRYLGRAKRKREREKELERESAPKQELTEFLSLAPILHRLCWIDVTNVTEADRVVLKGVVTALYFQGDPELLTTGEGGSWEWMAEPTTEIQSVAADL